MPRAAPYYGAGDRGGDLARSSSVPPAAATLDDAIMAFRRGEPVLLTARTARCWRSPPSWSTDAEPRAACATCRAGGWAWSLTAPPRRRARPRAARGADRGGARSPSPPHLSAAVIRNLADPAASLGVEPPGLGPKPASANATRAGRGDPGQARRSAARGAGLVAGAGRGRAGAPPRRYCRRRHRPRCSTAAPR